MDDRGLEAGLQVLYTIIYDGPVGDVEFLKGIASVLITLVKGAIAFGIAPESFKEDQIGLEGSTLMKLQRAAVRL